MCIVHGDQFLVNAVIDFVVSFLFIIQVFHVCSWGPVLERGNYKTKQRLYLSEQVNFLYFTRSYLFWLLANNCWLYLVCELKLIDFLVIVNFSNVVKRARGTERPRLFLYEPTFVFAFSFIVSLLVTDYSFCLRLYLPFWLLLLITSSFLSNIFL